MRSTHNRLRRAAPVALALVALLTLAGTLAPLEARSRGHRGPGFGRIGFAPRIGYGYGFYGYSLRYGFPYYGHRPYVGRGELGAQPHPAFARALDLGALDLNVKPRKAEVHVNGQFVGLARELDGYPSLLWLKAGTHTITIYKGGYATFEDEIEIAPGVVEKLKLQLLPGGGAPPERVEPAGTST